MYGFELFLQNKLLRTRIWRPWLILRGAGTTKGSRSLTCSIPSEWVREQRGVTPCVL